MLLYVQAAGMHRAQCQSKTPRASVGDGSTRACRFGMIALIAVCIGCSAGGQVQPRSGAGEVDDPAAKPGTSNGGDDASQLDARRRDDTALSDAGATQTPNTNEVCDTSSDFDCDGVNNATDNCPDVKNSDQVKTPGNSLGNACTWPNAQSAANSDPWLAQHHDDLRMIQPRVLAINFVATKTMGSMNLLLSKITAAMREGSRYHGYEPGSTAKPFLDYQLAYSIDLRDAPGVRGSYYPNSTHFPAVPTSVRGRGVDYGAFFTQAFADTMAIKAGGTRSLRLCELVERGLVHEVWIYAHHGPTGVSPAEAVGIKPFYKADFTRDTSRPLSKRAGAGINTFESGDVIPDECTRSIRIAFINHERLQGAFVHSLGHALEAIATSNTIPYFSKYFKEFAGLDLDTHYGLPFRDWYTCPGGPDACLTYPNADSVNYTIGGTHLLAPYVAPCNVHFPPNARKHYDYDNAFGVTTACATYRTADNATSIVDRSAWQRYLDLGSDDSGGHYLIWWMQNMPGLANRALDDDGKPMKNWWPFVYY